MDNVDYQVLATHSHELMCVATLEGYFVWTNPSFTRTLGWTMEELLERPFLELIHPDDVPATLQEMERLSQGFDTLEFINRYRSREGVWYWLEWSGKVVEDRIYAIARDITARKKTEQQDREHATLVEMALQIGNIGHWSVDLVNNALHWSEEIYRIHGLDPETYTPTLASGIDAYHPEDQGRVSALIESAIRDQEPFSFELRLVRPSGEIRRVVSHGTPQVDALGDVIGIFGVFRDITNDKSVLRQLELEQLASVAAHDLREPVRTIHAYLELLEEMHEDTFSQDPTRTYATFIRKAAAKLNTLVSNLLRFTEAGQRVQLRPVNLERILRVVSQRIQEAEPTRDVPIHIEGASPYILGASHRLITLFEELVRNAMVYCDAAEPRIKIHVQPIGSHWQITVEDNGSGLNEASLARALLPFQRLHDGATGTGIGLAIARQIVIACEGRIWLESKPGRHRVHVVLPGATSKATDEEA